VSGARHPGVGRRVASDASVDARPARRRALGTLLALAGVHCVPRTAWAIGADVERPAQAPADDATRARLELKSPTLSEDFAVIERTVGGRLGVAVVDPTRGPSFGHREDERFPLCSTFKLLLAAHVLARVDAGLERLDREVRYSAGDLVTYSPTTGPNAARGAMRIDALCEAAMVQSDNTAANLLLRETGGPAAVTRFVRTLGDEATRLDRIEPALNEARPGDPRDTTTPAAMAGSIRALLFRSALSGSSRAALEAWLRANLTGGARLRAGLAPGWQAGEKTGTGERGTTNDVGLLWTPRGMPLIVTAYLTDCDAPAAAREAAIAGVARAIVSHFTAPAP
jgi:beta-lactamase class A